MEEQTFSNIDDMYDKVQDVDNVHSFSMNPYDNA
jgi:hypothetical protein